MAKRGSRMGKSETIQLRLNPLSKWALELAAGRERRSLSSFIEWATEKLIRELHGAFKQGRDISVWEVAEKCWHPDPIWRLVRLASDYPELLTFNDRAQWQAVLLMVSIEQNIEPKKPVGGFMVDVEWLPAMHKVWPYIVGNAENLDMDEVRRLYLEARESCRA